MSHSNFTLHRFCRSKRTRVCYKAAAYSAGVPLYLYEFCRPVGPWRCSWQMTRRNTTMLWKSFHLQGQPRQPPDLRWWISGSFGKHNRMILDRIYNVELKNNCRWRYCSYSFTGNTPRMSQVSFNSVHVLTRVKYYVDGFSFSLVLKNILSSLLLGFAFLFMSHYPLKVLYDSVSLSVEAPSRCVWLHHEPEVRRGHYAVYLIEHDHYVCGVRRAARGLHWGKCTQSQFCLSCLLVGHVLLFTCIMMCK